VQSGKRGRRKWSEKDRVGREEFDKGLARVDLLRPRRKLAFCRHQLI
jgi:hypothetical protein